MRSSPFDRVSSRVISEHIWATFVDELPFRGTTIEMACATGNIQMENAREGKLPKNRDALTYVQYSADKEAVFLPEIRQLISKDLSEPYSIYVYRYFLYQWGDLCFMVRLLHIMTLLIILLIPLTTHQALNEHQSVVGVVVSKLEPHRGGPLRGYIAMLAVREEWRGCGIATDLVRKAIDAMIEQNAEEVCISSHHRSQCILWD